MALYREQWDNSSMCKDFIGMGFYMLFSGIVQNHDE